MQECILRYVLYVIMLVIIITLFSFNIFQRTQHISSLLPCDSANKGSSARLFIRYLFITYDPFVKSISRVKKKVAS